MFGIIYKATNKINGKVYIGQTVSSLSGRKHCHIRDAIKRDTNNYFHNAIKKYSKEAFTWEIIDTCESREELDCKESYYIGYYRAIANYNNYRNYNITDGADKTAIFKGKDNYFYGKLGDKHPSSKKYKIISPEGKIYIVKGLRQFCRDNPEFNLKHNHLSYCALGKQKSTKGWTCSYYEVLKDAQI